MSEDVKDTAATETGIPAETIAQALFDAVKARVAAIPDEEKRQKVGVRISGLLQLLAKVGLGPTRTNGEAFAILGAAHEDIRDLIAKATFNLNGGTAGDLKMIEAALGKDNGKVH